MPTADTTPPVSEMLSDLDKMTLEVARMQRRLVIANTEKALAQNEASEATFKCVVLQLYLKYGLDPATDKIDENGNIQRASNKKEDTQ
jgi:hypothetical protein